MNQLQTPISGPKLGSSIPLTPNKRVTGIVIKIIVCMIIAAVIVGGVFLVIRIWKPSPGKVIEKMLAEMEDVNTLHYSVKGDIKPAEGFEIFVDFNSDLDKTNPEATKTAGDFDIVMSSDDEQISLAGEYKNIGGVSFLKLDNLKKDQALGYLLLFGLDFSKLIENEWIKIEQPNKSKSSSEDTYIQELEKEIQDQKEITKKLKGRLKDKELYIVKKELADETINNIKVRHYLVNLDKEKVKGIIDLLWISRVITSIERIEEISGEIWIGKKDNYLYKVKLGGKDNIVNLEIEFSNFNKPIEIKEPTDYKTLEEVLAEGKTIEPLIEEMHHIEGVVGQPWFINPVYATSDIERDLVQLTFSGLMKYDENIQIVPDLAEDYTIEENGKIYTFKLKENLFWQDKTPLNVDDIIFTIKTIQNPDFKSPWMMNWVGVEVEKIDDLTVRFKLKKPYAPFLENCTINILPEHIWQDVSPESFAFQAQDLKPIGSGPYQIKETKKDGAGFVKSIILTRNPYYFGNPPYISEINFLFFENEEKLIQGAKQDKIKGLWLDYFTDLGKNWQTYSFSLPRYFAVFFNQEKSKVLSYREVRLALNYGTNKKELGQKIVDSPILPEIYSFESPSKIYQFDIEKAKQILEEAGFKDKDKDGVREKIIKFEESEEVLTLKISLVIADQPQMVRVAKILKNQWQKLGVELEIKKYPLIHLEQDFIRPRNYQALLFGEVLGALPDPFPFWHSSRIEDPGVNLALYRNKKADDLLEENRESFSPEKLAQFQDILIEDVPCVFLYSPDYIYFVSKEIKGLKSGKIIEPSKRFIGIENWYIKTEQKIFEDPKEQDNSEESNDKKYIDMAIKADLSGLRSSAELYAWNENNESYLGFCTNRDALRADQVIADNGSKMYCADTVNTWIACAQLKEIPTDSYCVDWKGNSKQLINTICNSSFVATNIKCP
ncbi:peptide ABC transporter substrate-binding protein [Patescibacteria group bacterium]|nr:peptide ABC transporter substrate-binding protein [Patescibacteria group bacterium]